MLLLPSCLDFSVVKKADVNRVLALKLLCASIQAYDITDTNVSMPGYTFVGSFKGRDLVKRGDRSVLGPNIENFGKIYSSVETDSDGKPKSIIISFRGSSSIQNWISDFTFIPVATNYLGVHINNFKVHSGIFSVYNTFKDRIINPNNTSPFDVLNDLDSNKNANVYITGHSLGGALAVLFTLELVYRLGYPKENITMYNYAAPRAGNSVFAETYDAKVNTLSRKNSIRFVNDNDLVPRLPIERLGSFEYKHVKNYYLFCFKPDQTANGFSFIADCHVQKNYFKILKDNLNNNYNCPDSDTTTDLNTCMPSTYYMLSIGRYLQNNPESMRNLPQWIKDLLGL